MLLRYGRQGYFLAKQKKARPCKQAKSVYKKMQSGSAEPRTNHIERLRNK
jgi:hypothetical protein